MRSFSLGLLATSLLSTPLMASPIQTLFVIGMENHDLTEPNGHVSSPQQLQGNAAAPYLNSLMTPGNPNAQYTSYASNMTNVAPGIHPSEPNYIWENGGSNFGVLSDADPSAASHNIIPTTSLTGLMTDKGVTWKSYQEDVQYSASPLISASGTGGTHNGNTVTTNPYNGTLQYNFAVKHNPMAFFSDSFTNPNSALTFANLQTDLQNNTYAQYNWITPNQFNDMHSALNGGFTYQGTHFTGDQAAIAQGDNFLATIVPQIEATNAFQDGSGLIEIWFDESEGGDSSAFTIPEIIISKDAIGNAFDVTELLTHNADLLSNEELFHLGECLGASCGSPDLSAFLTADSIPTSVPETSTLALFAAGLFGVGLFRRRQVADSVASV